MPVVVLVLGELKISSKLGEEGGQMREVGVEGRVQLALLIGQVERPEDGWDVGEERGRAVDLSSNHPTISTSVHTRYRVLQPQQSGQLVPHFPVMGRHEDLLPVPITPTIRLPALLGRDRGL